MNLTELTQIPNHSMLRLLGAIDPAADVLGITEDSRRVAPGWIFVARPGLRADGRRFIPDALRAGALAVLTDQPLPSGVAADAPVLLVENPAYTGAILAERLAGSPSESLSLVGVTGTNGKTTIASLISRAACAAGLRSGLIGTVEVDDGAGVTLSDYTTPPAELLSPMLARMYAHGCQAAAMEVSSHALDQHRTAGLRFAAGVMTNLTGDHLDYHGDMEHYAQAKARLFAQLPTEAVAVVNVDDPWHERVTGGCRGRVFRCAQGDGTTKPSGIDAYVTFANVSVQGMRVELTGPWGVLCTQTRLVGAHNAMNLLQTVAVCSEVFDIAPELMQSIIPTLHAPAGRLEPVNSEEDDITVLVDFAHTDDALRNCLHAARLATPENARLWVVFGCGGEKDRTKRPRMGGVAAAAADRVIVTSDNPRTENPDSIIEEILAGIESNRRKRVSRIADRREAISAALREAVSGDVVVIAGKGHEREQELPDGKGGTQTVPFDDAQVVREHLAKRRSSMPSQSTPMSHGSQPGRVQL